LVDVANALAFVWLLVAACTGLLLTFPWSSNRIIELGRFTERPAGLVGFLAQIVVGIQERLLPLYGWYRMMESNHMKPPARSAHPLAHHGLTRAILVAWTIGVPSLVLGLTTGNHLMIGASCALLLVGVTLNATQVITIVTSD
jgi:hypothetical protein